MEGYSTLEFEGSAIFFSEEHHSRGLSQNAIWLSLDEWSESQSECHLEYCFVEGRFNAEKNGQWGSYNGSIEDIYRIEKSLSESDIEEIRHRSNETTANKHKQSGRPYRPSLL